MTILLYTNWWTSLAWEKQAFWSLAVVFSILLAIRLMASLLDGDEENAPATAWLDSRSILAYFAGVGWVGLLLFHNTASLTTSLFWAGIAGLLPAIVIRWISLGQVSKKSPRKGELLTTGEVLQSIPPHRNGFGTVQFVSRKSPYQVDAITAGDEIPRGTPVRVVDVLDERVILVEAIGKSPYPGQRPDQSS